MDMLERLSRSFSLRNSALMVVLGGVLLVMSSLVAADERRESDSPFKIDDFAPKKGRYSLSAGVGYSVVDSKKISVSTVAIPTTHGYILMLPDVTLDNRRKDQLFSRMGMRYAVGNGFNLSFGVKAGVGRSLIRENDVTHTDYESGWNNLTAGFDYRLTTPFDHPFVLAFAEFALAENNGSSTFHGRSAVVGVSSHWAFDPVIVSLTGTYSYLGERVSQGKSHDPGDVLGVAASFGVVINPEITIRTGVSQSFQSGGKFDGESGEWGSSTSFSLGYTQRLSSRLVMNIDAQAGVAGNDSAQIATNFTWRP